jgi:catechol 2,3-dioxygenase-like lactoylglutathione lyase family enzyme
MFSKLRSARPTNNLAALRHFYVEALGCVVVAEWLDHEGIDGLVLGDPESKGKDWQVEFIREHGVTAPQAPTSEHLLVFYVDDALKLDAITQRMNAYGYTTIQPNNPYWARCGVTFADPDGYHVVVAKLPSTM